MASLHGAEVKVVPIDLDVMQNPNYPTTSTLTLWVTVQMSYDGPKRACAVSPTVLRIQ